MNDIARRSVDRARHHALIAAYQDRMIRRFFAGPIVCLATARKLLAARRRLLAEK